MVSLFFESFAFAFGLRLTSISNVGIIKESPSGLKYPNAFAVDFLSSLLPCFLLLVVSFEWLLLLFVQAPKNKRTITNNFFDGFCISNFLKILKSVFIRIYLK